jgi:hypothetical protein
MGVREDFGRIYAGGNFGRFDFSPFFLYNQADSNDKAFGLENLWKKAQKHYP